MDNIDKPKKKKFYLKIIYVLLLITISVIFSYFVMLNPLLKSSIEDKLSQRLGEKVTIEELDYNITTPTILKNITVGNNLIRIPEARFESNLSSIASDDILLKNLIFEDVQVFHEQTSENETNFTNMLKQLSKRLNSKRKVTVDGLTINCSSIKMFGGKGELINVSTKYDKPFVVNDIDVNISVFTETLVFGDMDYKNYKFSLKVSREKVLFNNIIQLWSKDKYITSSRKK